MFGISLCRFSRPVLLLSFLYLLAVPSGGWSQTTGHAPADQAAFDTLVMGKRTDWEPANAIEWVSPGRFSQTIAGVAYSGSYTYQRTGPNAATTVFNYDIGLTCTTRSTFTTATSGRASYTCSAGQSAGPFDWRLTDGSAAPNPLPGFANTAPTFGFATVAAQTFMLGAAIAPVALPAAMGGDQPFRYGLAPALPAGLSYTLPTESAAGVISGVPTETQPPTEYMLTVTDIDGDAATLTFTLTVIDNRGRGALRATLLSLSPWQAWVHLYCLKDRADPDAAPCAVTFECNGQTGEPVTWPVTVAPKTIFSYWPNKTMAGLSANLEAALIAAGKPEDEARRRTTCEVFSPDPLTVRGYTLFGGQPTLVPVAEPARPAASAESGERQRWATLLNLSPWQAWVHLYCLKDRADPDAAPCAVTFECNGQSGEPASWPVTVAPKTIFSYWPNKTAPDGTAADLQAALIAAGKLEDEARRRTTCEVSSADPIAVRGYTRFGGQPTLVPVTAY